MQAKLALPLDMLQLRIWYAASQKYLQGQLDI
jgi:hypothetical protein